MRCTMDPGLLRNREDGEKRDNREDGENRDNRDDGDEKETTGMTERIRGYREDDVGERRPGTCLHRHPGQASVSERDPGSISAIQMAHKARFRRGNCDPPLHEIHLTRQRH